MKWLYSLFSLVLLSVFATVFIYPVSVHASSPYDNAIQKVLPGDMNLYDEGIFGGPNTSPFSVNLDSSTSWKKFAFEGKYRCSSADPTLSTSESDSLFAALSSPTAYYSVSLVKGYALSKNYSVLNIYWSDMPINGSLSNDPFQRLRFQSSQVVHYLQVVPLSFGGGASDSSNTTGYCSFYTGTTSTDSQQDLSNVNYTTSNTVSTTSVGIFEQKNLVIDFPPGYDGQELPSTGVLSVTRTPSVVADISPKKLAFKSPLDSVVNSQYPGYKIHWVITNVDIGVTDNPCTEPYTQILLSNPEQYNVLDLPCNGVYQIQGIFAYSSGDFPVASFLGFTIKTLTVNVNVDGSTYSINTSEYYNCNTDGYCQLPTNTWVDEPCDLLNIGGCVNNVIHYIAVFLGIDKNPSNPTGSPFVSFNNNTNGLTAIIAAPISAIQSLTSQTCSTVTFTIPYIDKVIVLPCYYAIYQANLGTIFTLYQTIVTGFISYYVIVGVLRTIKEIKDPKKDQIEVLHL